MDSRLLVLGSASGVTTARRLTTAIALQFGEAMYLLDCGAPVATQLARLGDEFDYMRIRAVFLSHWHVDHVHGLPMLVKQGALQFRASSMKVLGPAGTEDAWHMLEKIYFLNGHYSYDLYVSDAPLDQDAYTDEILTARFFPTRHLQPAAPPLTSEAPAVPLSLGVRLELRKPTAQGIRVIIYSGDCRTAADIEPHLAGCDLLIHEFGHHSPASVGTMAERAGVPRLLAAHIGPAWDTIPEQLAAELRTTYSGEVTVAEDLLIMQL